MRPLRWRAEFAPLGWDRVKVSENLGTTAVAPVAPADTSLIHMNAIKRPSTSSYDSSFAHLPTAL